MSKFPLLLAVGSRFECFYCYVNKLKSIGPNTINLVEKWA